MIRGNDRDQAYLRSVRLLIAYREDTVILDIHGSPGDNPVGAVDRMDSIVILQGYYRFFRNHDYDARTACEKEQYLMYNGVRPDILKFLLPSGLDYMRANA